METILLGLATALSKALLKAWLGSGAGGSVAADFAQLLQGPVSNLVDRRRTGRLFERMADDVALKLQPLLEVEFRQLTENEATAAVLAVQRAFEVAEITDELLVDLDMDATSLEAALRERVGDLAKENFLNATGTDLYDLLLAECCAYFVELRLVLPTFTPVALTELLRRDTEIQQQLSEVLRRMPELQGNGALSDPHTAFELKYLRKLAQDLDQLTLYGVTLAEDVKRYALSVAYITLTAKAVAPTGARGLIDEGLETLQDETEAPAGVEDDHVRIDSILLTGSRHFIRGIAGSGKTTLLQWLAVRSARSEFDGDLEGWNGVVPFFLQLRRYVATTLPAPEEFLHNVTRNLEHLMPSGWVHRTLEEGRGLILIDGVDELPEDERERTRRWLEGLLQDFPNNRVIVTSRPTAVTENWLTRLDFKVSVLQPMEPPDIIAFIEHWHDAAAASAPPEESEDIRLLGLKLAAAVRERPQLQALATSPLLCALLCALHRDRQTQLPSDRLELYRIALEMLLERRDTEREVANVGEVKMALPSKQILLNEFAYWLMLNGRSDAGVQELTSCIDRRMPGLNILPATTAEDVGRYLLERSGVLRAPVVGRVDFVHRTFQEYFAAQEAVNQGSIDFLIQHAHEDHWREVVIMAAGLARAPECESLISGLIARGRQEEQNRHRLHLLAIACMETIRELSPSLRTVLGELLDELIPPANMSDARAVASAGDLAVPLLAQHAGARALTSAACVRGLSLIRSSDAMDAIKLFAADERVTVSREVVRAWRNFDAEAYAEQVLADSPLDRGEITITDVSIAPCLRHLKHLTSVTVWARSRTTTLEPLTACADKIWSLNLDSAGIADFGPISLMSRLDRLSIWNSPGLLNVDFLAPIEPRTILLVWNRNLADLRGLNRAACKTLTLANCIRVVDLEQVGVLADCTYLDIEATGIANVEFIGSGFPSLNRLDVSRTRIESLRGVESSGIRQLVARHASLTTIEAVALVPRLNGLYLTSCHAIESFDPLEGCGKLTQLDLARTHFSDVSVIGSLRSLRILTLSLSDVTSLDGIQELANLRSLNLSGLADLWDLTPLLDLNLSYLALAGSGFEKWDLLLDLGLSRVMVDQRCPTNVVARLRDVGVTVDHVRA